MSRLLPVLAVFGLVLAGAAHLHVFLATVAVIGCLLVVSVVSLLTVSWLFHAHDTLPLEESPDGHR